MGYDLEEYRKNKPLLAAKDVELERAMKRMKHLELELFEKEYEWSVSEHEIERLNQGLEMSIDVNELGKLAEDLFHHPSKYADIIRTMHQRSKLQAALPK